MTWELFLLVTFEEFIVFHFSPLEVIKVDAVLGMITPIGAQMEYDRERVSIVITSITLPDL